MRRNQQLVGTIHLDCCGTTFMLFATALPTITVTRCHEGGLLENQPVEDAPVLLQLFSLVELLANTVKKQMNAYRLRE